MTSEEFVSDDENSTNFIDRISAFLSIPTNKLKIVGIKSTSRRRILLDGEIMEDGESSLQLVIKGGVPGSKETGYNASEEYYTLKNYAEQLQQGIKSGTINTGYKVYIQDVKYEVFVAKEAGKFGKKDLYCENCDEDENEDEDQKDQKYIKKQQVQKQQKLTLIGIIIGTILGVTAIVIIIKLVHNYYQNKMKVYDSSEKEKVLKKKATEESDVIALEQKHLPIATKSITPSQCSSFRHEEQDNQLEIDEKSKNNSAWLYVDEAKMQEELSSVKTRQRKKTSTSNSNGTNNNLLQVPGANMHRSAEKSSNNSSFDGKDNMDINNDNDSNEKDAEDKIKNKNKKNNNKLMMSSNASQQNTLGVSKQTNLTTTSMNKSNPKHINDFETIQQEYQNMLSSNNSNTSKVWKV